MNPEEQVEHLLAQSGAVLKRTGHHLVYELPNGQNFVRAKTPSDVRAAANQLSDLRHRLGIVPEHKEGERRERKNKPGRHDTVRMPSTPMAEALLKSGVVETAQKTRIAELEAEVARLQAIVDQVDNVLVVNWCGPRIDGDYRKALMDLQSGAIREHEYFASEAKWYRRLRRWLMEKRDWWMNREGF